MFTRKRFDELVRDGRIWFGVKGSNVPRLKQFRSEIQSGLVPVTVWLHEVVGHNQEAKQELKAIFPDDNLPFDTPKPVRLLRQILQIASDKNSLLLDSFAGSGTTAHALMALNKEDGGQRSFIMVECEDYADKVTAERVRRVIRGVKPAKDKDLKKGLGGSFSYFELGKPIELESILSGDALPSYNELARYVFYTATGEEFDEGKVVPDKHFVGEASNYQVYLFYEPNIDKLKNLAFTLDMAKALPAAKKGKRRLVFAPTKYLDQDHLDELKIDFAQLPYEIYELTR